MAYLIVQFEQGQSQRVTLARDVLVIGRGTSCDLQIIDDKISRRHCQVSQQNGQWVLDDLASRNKTWMGPEPIDRVVLADGNEFRIGKTYIIFQSQDPQADDAKAPPNGS